MTPADPKAKASLTLRYKDSSTLGLITALLDVYLDERRASISTEAQVVIYNALNDLTWFVDDTAGYYINVEHALKLLEQAIAIDDELEPDEPLPPDWYFAAVLHRLLQTRVL
jgi:hypothetical protein